MAEIRTVYFLNTNKELHHLASCFV